MFYLCGSAICREGIGLILNLQPTHAAKRLANSIPTEVLLDWNSTPVELLGQTKQSFSRCNGVIADTTAPAQHERSATVEIALHDDPVTFSDMEIVDYLPIRKPLGGGRLAKSRALVNIKASLEDAMKPVDTKSLTCTRGKSIKRRAIHSTSPEHPVKRQCKTEKERLFGLNSSVHHSVSHSGTEPNNFHETDSGELQDSPNRKHSPVRNFSIKLHRVPASSPTVLPCKHNSRAGAGSQ